jgi:hypothetical protein
MDDNLFILRPRWSSLVNTNSAIYGESGNYPTECWIWMGATNDAGYGVSKLDNIHMNVHRIAYIVFTKANRKTISDLDIDHVCRNRLCLRPSHLRAVTRRFNTLIGIGPTAVNAAKTHCINGHLLNEENLDQYESKIGKRACSECRRVRQNNYYLRKVGGLNG